MHTGYFRIPLKIHFGGRANLFLAGLRQTKAALSTDKADLSSLPASKNLLLAAQKQLLELPFMDKSGYNADMTSKEIAIKTIQEMPDSVSWDDIEERIRFLAAIDKGLDDIRAGRVIPHMDVKESLTQWLSA